MTNPLQLPFDFPPNTQPTTQQLEANFGALLQFVQDLNDAVVSLSNLVLTSSLQLPDGTANSPALKYTNALTTGLYKAGSSTLGISTGGVQAWQADGNSHITQPLQPSFLVTRPTPAVGWTGNSGNLTFNESYDVGGNFLSDTFTAPVSGKYFFSVALNIGPNGGTATTFTIRLLNNGSVAAIMFKTIATGTDMASFSTVLDLVLGDAITVAVTVTGSATWSSEASVASSFTGTLIN